MQKWRCNITNSAESRSGEMLKPWHETRLVSLEMAFALTHLSLVINLAKVFPTFIFLSCWCMMVEPQRSMVWQWQRRNSHPLWVAVVFYFLWLSTPYFISWILGSCLSLCVQSCGWELHECALHSFGLWLSCWLSSGAFFLISSAFNIKFSFFSRSLREQ